MHKRICFLTILAVFAITGYAADTPNPSAQWQPVQVVGFQLEALRTNKPANDKGIAAAYRFASPSNKAAIGGVKNFGQLLHGGYTDMLTHTAAKLQTVKIEGDQAVIGVTLTLPGDITHKYFFILGRNHGAPCDDCWLTDGVIPLQERTPSPLQSI